MTLNHPPTSCDDIVQAGLLSVEQARDLILKPLSPISEFETIPLLGAAGRVLASDVVAKINVPGHDNSAMDGYAVRSDDLPEGGETSLKLVGDAFAGHPYPREVASGECIRIMTGAPIPPGTDTVIMQEVVDVTPDGIRIGSGQVPGQHVRKAGEDITKNSTVLVSGTRLGPAELGVIASLGQAEVAVTRRLKVAFFSTGDELGSLGKPLQPGQIHDSNRYSLAGLLQAVGVELIDLGIIADDRDLLRQTLVDAASQADAVITSGGVSVGEADYIKSLLDELGQVDIWRVAMKPGKPLTFGSLLGSWFFGLPGNPVSVMVTFIQFVRPALQKMSGMEPAAALQIQVPTASALKKQPGRAEYQRGVLVRDESGRWVVQSTGTQSSGVLSSMTQANCFIVIPADSEGAEIGELVTVEPFTY